MHEHNGALNPLVSEIKEVPAQLLTAQHALVDHGAARQRGEIGLFNCLFHQASNDETFPIKLEVPSSVEGSQNDLHHDGLTGERPWPQG